MWRVARSAEEALAELIVLFRRSDPAPASLTDSITSRPLRFAATVIVEPLGEYFAALSTI